MVEVELTPQQIKEAIEEIFLKIEKGEYSKIKTIYMRNFMSIPDAEIPFTEEGIISFVGKNSRGKSAIRKVFNILMYDDMQREQYKLITWGKDSFGIGLEFDDGISINKYKYTNGSSCWEMTYLNKYTVYTNDVNGVLTSVPTVPKIIRTYIGAVKDNITGELLNIRTNMDAMFLVATSGADNYKILNSVLKTDTMSKAVTKLNKSLNTLNTDLTVQTQRLLELEKEVDDVVILNDTETKFVDYQVDLLTETIQRSNHLEEIKSVYQSIDRNIPKEMETINVSKYQNIAQLKNMLDTLKQTIPKEVNTIETQKLSLLGVLKNVFTELKNTKIPTKISIVDNKKYEALSSLKTLKKGLEDTKVPKEVKILNSERLKLISSVLQELGTLQNTNLPKSVPPVPTEKVRKVLLLEEFSKNRDELTESQKQLESLEEEETKLKEEMNRISKEYGVSICKNCGTIELGTHVHN